ncbi:phage major capsid protein [Pseudomonas aeruginosa]|uniref:phage major capsid protein n=1 Tax=Pseudomonas aeruginosa TaxID=287 RepID=UPI000F6C7D58|nr:phage major capsid protein [Pseudomonas aeruginosa]VEF98802.1 peptidase U35, phage prohead HK97 [Pseudomonas aeruginosa]
MNRAYSIFEVKALDEGARTITGVATTPSPDRVGDIVEPLGVEFKNPLPLLWQHEHDKPVGTVKFDKPTAKGITFTAQLADVQEEGRLRDRIDEAWQSLKAGLVRGVSIGFRPLEYSWMDEGGIRFIKSEVFELSLVTIPANADATINTIKSLDRQQLASLGKQAAPVVRVNPAGASATSKKSKPIPKPEEGNNMKTIAQQISAFEATLQEKQARMDELIAKSGEEGTTFDAEQKEEYGTLKVEAEELEIHLGLLRDKQKREAAAAKAVTDDPRGAKSLEVKEGIQVRAKNTEKLEPGIAFARVARVKALAHIEHMDPTQIAKSLYPNDDRLIATLTQKAAVDAANTLNAGWAANLITDGGTPFADFVEYLRPRTLLGQISDRLRRLPFDTPVLIQASTGSGKWVKEGIAKPLTEWSYTKTNMKPLKVAAIAAATKEMLMRGSVAVDALIRDELARAVGATIDTTFIDPDAAAVADESPASILNGVAPTTLSAGTDYEAVRCDIATLMNAFIASNNTLQGAFWLMPETLAVQLSQMVNPLGQPAFPGITYQGGTLGGIPVFTSSYVGTDSNGSVLALVKGDEIFLGDEGGIQVSMSDQASLVMDSAPTMNSTGTPVPAQVVSMWQTNSVAFLVERFINWQRRRFVSVAWGYVNYSACA